MSAAAILCGLIFGLVVGSIILAGIVGAFAWCLVQVAQAVCLIGEAISGGGR